MNIDLGILDKLTRAVILLILLAIGLFIGLWYLPLIQQNERMRKQILRLETQLQQEQDAARQLKAKVDASADPKTIERIARDKFGYAKPGETVIRFEEPPTNPAGGSR